MKIAVVVEGKRGGIELNRRDVQQGGVVFEVQRPARADGFAGVGQGRLQRERARSKRGHPEVAGHAAGVDVTGCLVRYQQALTRPRGDQSAGLRIPAERTERGCVLRVAIEVEDPIGSDHQITRLLHGV